MTSSILIGIIFLSNVIRRFIQNFLIHLALIIPVPSSRHYRLHSTASPNLFIGGTNSQINFLHLIRFCWPDPTAPTDYRRCETIWPSFMPGNPWQRLNKTIYSLKRLSVRSDFWSVGIGSRIQLSGLAKSYKHVFDYFVKFNILSTVSYFGNQRARKESCHCEKWFRLPKSISYEAKAKLPEN